MQTRTKPQQTSRMGRRATPAPQGRFKRSPAPKASTGDKAMSALSGMLGGGSAAKKGGRANAKGGGRAGKMALLAGGVGLAMKNRDKLTALLNKRAANRSAATAAQPSPPPPSPGAPGA